MTRSKRTSLGGDTVGAVHQDVDRLLVQAAVYREIFGTEAGKRVVNSISVHAFYIILHALREAMILGVARTLYDPAEDGKFKNLGLETIVSSLPWSNSDVGERLDDLRQKHDALRITRNKLYSHRDEDTVYDIMYGRENVVRSVFDLHVLDAIDEIVDLWRAMLNGLGVSMQFTEEIDAHELIDALR